MKKMSGAELRWALEEGGNIGVGAKDYTGSELRWAAEAARKSGATLIIQNASVLSSTDVRWISEAGGNNVTIMM